MVGNISRSKHMTDKVVFVDGMFGSGKSLLSSIISSLDRVELLSFISELECTCALHNLGKMSDDAAKAMVGLQTDLKLYATMMGRDVNFRAGDMSSAMKHHNPSRYFQRLFGPGDQHIPEIIKTQRPILNIAVHNLLSMSEPIWERLGDRCIFVEMVRHPAYTIKQQSYQIKMSDDERGFAVCYKHKGAEVPYYAYGWEDKFLESSPVEKAVYYVDALTKRNNDAREKIRKTYGGNILTVPFEPFVLSPEEWIEKIASMIGTSTSSATKKVMFEQNIPRGRVSDGIDEEAYVRYGWTPSMGSVDEKHELEIRKQKITSQIGAAAESTFKKIAKDYENKFWSPGSIST